MVGLAIFCVAYVDALHRGGSKFVALFFGYVCVGFASEDSKVHE
jgi:hypothetical protein